MTENEQRNYKLRPRNKVQGFAKGKIKINHSVPVLGMGDIEIIGTGPILVVDGINLIELNTDEENLLISVKVFDSGGELICEISNNEWVSGNPFAWDIIWKHQFIKIREKRGKINFQLDSKSVPLVIKARLYFGTNLIKLGEDSISFRNQNILPGYPLHAPSGFR